GKLGTYDFDRILSIRILIHECIKLRRHRSRTGTHGSILCIGRDSISLFCAVGIMTKAALPASGLTTPAIALFTLLLFSPALANGFVNLDDETYVTANPQVLGGLTLQNIAWGATTQIGSNWHPLTWLSLQLDATLFGSGPRGFHFTSVLIHAVTAAL